MTRVRSEGVIKRVAGSVGRVAEQHLLPRGGDQGSEVDVGADDLDRARIERNSGHGQRGQLLV